MATYAVAVPSPWRSMPVKQVVAIVKPYLAEKVLEALRDAPLEACGVREVKGYGRQKSYLDEYRGSEYSLAFLPKVEITLWVDDLRVDEVMQTIVEIARSGRMGDGKIFVLPAAIGGLGEPGPQEADEPGEATEP
jgi:nitrogen regulatory protein PII